MYCEDYDETQPTDRKMEEDGVLATKLTQIQLFSGTEKDVIITIKVTSDSQPIAGDTVWYVTARSGKCMSQISYSRIKTYTIVRFDTSITLNQNQKNPQRLQ